MIFLLPFINGNVIYKKSKSISLLIVPKSTDQEGGTNNQWDANATKWTNANKTAACHHISILSSSRHCRGACAMLMGLLVLVLIITTLVLLFQLFKHFGNVNAKFILNIL